MQEPPIEDLYDRYYRRLVRYSRRRTPDVATAEDVAQETLARALAGMHRLDRSRPIWPWLRSIARHVASDQTARWAREATVAPEGPPRGADELLRVEDRAVVDSLLSEISPRQRLAMRLRYLEDRDPREAARLLGVSVPAFNQLLFRARQRLRHEVRRIGDGILGGIGVPVRWARTAWERTSRACGRAGRSIEAMLLPREAVGQLLAGLTALVLTLPGAGAPRANADDAAREAPSLPPILASESASPPEVPGRVTGPTERNGGTTSSGSEPVGGAAATGGLRGSIVDVETPPEASSASPPRPSTQQGLSPVQEGQIKVMGGKIDLCREPVCAEDEGIIPDDLEP